VLFVMRGQSVAEFSRKCEASGLDPNRTKKLCSSFQFESKRLCQQR
jgi:hypothetical protein